MSKLKKLFKKVKRGIMTVLFAEEFIKLMKCGYTRLPIVLGILGASIGAGLGVGIGGIIVDARSQKEVAYEQDEEAL